MTIAATAVASASPGTFDPLTITTGSFTPANGSLLVAIGGAAVAGAETPGDYSASFGITDSSAGGPLTWTPRANVGNTGSEGGQMRVWTAPVVTGVSMTVTLSTPVGNDMNRMLVSVIQVTGYDTVTPVGVTGTDAAIATDGADSVTLSGSPAATSLIIGGRAAGTPGTGTILASPDTGHTELHDLNITDNTGLQTQQRDAGSTSTAFSWADVANGTTTIANGVGLAIEIKERPALISDPTDIVGCTLWLDADDAGSITLSGAQITQWNDKSGNGWNFTPVAGGVGPDYTAATLNGRAVAVFDGSNDGLRNLSLIIAQPFTTFFVMLCTDPSNGSGLAILRGPTSDPVLGTHPVNGGSMFVGNGTSYPSNTYIMPVDSAFYATTIHDGANSDARLDGVAQFTNVNCGTSGTPNGTHIGRSAAFADSLGNEPGSYIAEVIIYDSALSSGDILDVEAYLNDKWFVSGAARRRTGVMVIT